jgi:MFS family permease
LRVERQSQPGKPGTPFSIVKLFEADSLWSYKEFRLFWLSNTIFVIGSGAFPVALAVVVLDNNGNDPKSLGFILGARVLAAVLFAPIAGVWADRIPRVKAMIAADFFRAGLVFSLVFLADPATPYWVLAIVVFLMGMGDALGAPASQAILPSLLPEHKLKAGNVARAVVVRTAAIVGPGVGATAVLIFGGPRTFIFTGVFFILGTTLMFFIKENFKPIAEEDKQKFFHDLREGLRTVWAIKWIFALIASTSFQLMFIVGVESVLLPVITRREFDTNTVFALSASAFSLGGIIGALVSLRLKIKHQGQFSLLMFTMLATTTLALAFPFSAYIIVGSYFLAGLSIGPWEAFWATAVQKEVPQELQGRVFSIDHMGSTALIPLGMVLVGPAAELFGERPMLIAVSIMHVLISIAVLRVTGVRDLKMPASFWNSSQGEQLKR